MTAPRTAPYGTWTSPISPAMVASGQIAFNHPVLQDGGAVYWAETRPAEGGRVVVVKWSPVKGAADMTPPPCNARTRVHEYGGGAFTAADGTLYFTNFADQQIYVQGPGAAPRALTAPSARRYADLVADKRRRRLICVCEDHAGPAVENFLAAVDLHSGAVTGLASGRDFYMTPRLSPDGARLAWLCWDLPHMPWEAAELWLGDINADGSVTGAVKVAGGLDVSAGHPLFSPDGTLYFAAEDTGWWNLYRYKNGRKEALHPLDAEFGLPLWGFGTATATFVTAERLLCYYNKDGRFHLAELNTKTLAFRNLDLPYTYIDSLTVTPDGAVFLAGSPTSTLALVRYELASGKTAIIKQAADIKLDAGYFSVPQAIEFPTEGSLTAHAFYYPPRNRDFTAPAGEKPPLIIVSHGGPTAEDGDVLNLGLQYWTSRGFAVADVNYGGSTGYGRAYRQRLDGQWGIVDVDDCVNCALYLAAQGLADKDRLIIRGGSAGGYTTLAALTFRDVFQAGASYYGISDLEALAKETHKLESRYLDSLIGPYPARRDLYLERSPIYHAEGLSCPVIFFQGAEDKVVPPAQAEKMAAALRARGVPVAYLLFPGEQHGFRKQENIRRALEAELYFYAGIFKFKAAGDIPPVEIL